MSFVQSSFYSKTHTATDDLPFPVEDDHDIILDSCNIHCLTNDAYYGNPMVQAAPIRVNAVIWFDAPVRLADIVFKNYTSGSNTTIIITGILHEAV
jgi:hypothetical protein